MNLNTKRSALLVLISGTAMFLSLLLMLILSGENPHPATYPNTHKFNFAIYWFELADHESEINQILGEPSTEIGTHLRKVINIINKCDYLFMVSYSLLFACLFVFFYSVNKNLSPNSLIIDLLLFSGLLLSAIMLIGDIIENMQLFKLADYGINPEIRIDTISSLKLWTRVKWIAIFTASILIAISCVLKEKKLFRISLAALYIISAILGIISISLFSARFLLEYSSNILGLAWLISTIYCGVFFFKKG
ncbi:MAG: hypothetical protein HQK76_06720 [Desulfobacterales bacterium]|nr:hypothetical protein [Desulfobacterales bacterium]